MRLCQYNSLGIGFRSHVNKRSCYLYFYLHISSCNSAFMLLVICSPYCFFATLLCVALTDHEPSPRKYGLLSKVSSDLPFSACSHLSSGYVLMMHLSARRVSYMSPSRPRRSRCRSRLFVIGRHTMSMRCLAPNMHWVSCRTLLS